MSSGSFASKVGAWVGEGIGARPGAKYDNGSLPEVDSTDEADFGNIGRMGDPEKFRDLNSGLLRADLIDTSFDDRWEAYVPKSSPSSVLARNIHRDHEYSLFKMAFSAAASSYLKDLGLKGSPKEALVKAGGIIDEKTAAIVLARFRTELLKHDPYRIDENKNSRREAKKLKPQEQLLLKLILEREFGLDFVSNPATAELNHKAFQFTVPLSRLNRLGAGRQMTASTTAA